MVVGIKKKSSLGFAQETTEGTHISAGASDMILARDINVEGLDPEMIERDYIDDTFGQRYPVASVRKPKISFETPIKYNGDTSSSTRSRPRVGLLLASIMGEEDISDSGEQTIDTSTTTQLDLTSGAGSSFTQYHACGVLNASSEIEVGWITSISSDSLTITPALSTAPSTDTNVYASAMYKQASSGFKSISFDYYDSDVMLHALSGCKGNMTITANNGEIPMMKWEFQGMTVTSSNDTDGPAFTPSYDSTVEKAIKQARIYIDGTAVVCENIEINLGVEVSPRPDQNADEGVKGFVVTNQQATIKMTGIEAENVTYLGNLASSTSSVITCQWGTELGNTFSVYIPRCYWSNSGLTSSDGKLIYELEGKTIKNSGNDAIYLAYL